MGLTADLDKSEEKEYFALLRNERRFLESSNRYPSHYTDWAIPRSITWLLGKYHHAQSSSDGSDPHSLSFSSKTLFNIIISSIHVYPKRRISFRFYEWNFLHKFITYAKCSARHFTLTVFIYLNFVKPTNYYHYTFYQGQETVTGFN